MSALLHFDWGLYCLKHDHGFQTSEQGIKAAAVCGTSQVSTQKEMSHGFKLMLKSCEKLVNSNEVACGGHLLITGTHDKGLRVWDLDMGKQVGSRVVEL
jgi:hypothetical protein